MATAESVTSKLQRLVDALNQATGGKETTFVNALIRFLIAVDKPDPVLESLTVTENGSYTPSDGVTGYNLVEVYVDTQPYYDDGYNMGYVDGQTSVDTQSYYNDGYNMGYADGQNSVDTQMAYDQGYTDGQSSVDTQQYYDDGYNTGYSEGYEAGRNSVETT